MCHLVQIKRGLLEDLASCHKNLKNFIDTEIDTEEVWWVE